MGSIIDYIASGKVESLSGEIPEVIFTTLSRVFIFRKAKRVLKIYRRDSDYWNSHFFDLSSGETRKKFIVEDFSWNRTCNPEAYLALKEAKLRDGEVTLIEPEGGDELVIEMNLVDTSHFLVPTLAGSEHLTEADYLAIGEQLIEIKSAFIQKPSLNKNWYEIFQVRTNDLKSWMDSIPAFPKSIVSGCASYLIKYGELHKARFERIGADEMVTTVDIHGENALYSDGKLSFIDIFPPKEIWSLAPQDIDILRLGVDIYALRGHEAYQQYLRGVRNKTVFENRDEAMNLVECSALMTCIEFTLAETKEDRREIAQKYFSFFGEILAKGISLLS